MEHSEKGTLLARIQFFKQNKIIYHYTITKHLQGTVFSE